MTFPDPNFKRSNLSLLAVESKTCNLIKGNEATNFKNNNSFDIQPTTQYFWNRECQIYWEDHF